MVGIDFVVVVVAVCDGVRVGGAPEAPTPSYYREWDEVERD